MSWTNLKAAIATAIRTNNNQEITGAILQNTLNSIVNSVGANATFAGIATPSTSPGTPDGPVFWIAGQHGIYSNFGNEPFTVNKYELGIFTWDGSQWSFDGISLEIAEDAFDDLNLTDATPTYALDKAIDIALTKYNNGDYRMLAQLHLPSVTNEKAGLMSVEMRNLLYNLRNAGYTFAGVATPSVNPGIPNANCFYIAADTGTYSHFTNADDQAITIEQNGIYVLTYDAIENNYWEYQLIKVFDEEPTPGSRNLVESGGVYAQLHKYLLYPANGGSRVVELYLEGLDTSKNYYFSSLRNVEGSIGIQIRDSDSNIVISKNIPFDLSNKIVILPPYNAASGVSGYGIFNINVDDTEVCQPSINKDFVSNINNSPTILNFIEEDIVVDEIALNLSDVENPEYGRTYYFAKDRIIYKYIYGYYVCKENRLVEYKNKLYSYRYREGLSEISATKYFNSEYSIPAIIEAYLYGAGVDSLHEYTLTVSKDAQYVILIIRDVTSSQYVSRLQVSSSFNNNYIILPQYQQSNVYCALVINWDILSELTGSSIINNDEFNNDVVLDIEQSPTIKALNIYNSSILGEHNILPCIPNDSNQWESGYYNRKGKFLNNIQTAKHYNIEIEENHAYNITTAYLNSSLSVVALDANLEVVEVVIPGPTSGYEFKNKFYLNKKAKYIAISFLTNNASLLNKFLSCSVEETQSELVKSVSLLSAEVDYLKEVSVLLTHIKINSLFARLYNTVVKVAFFGDSTYDGTNTSGWTGHLAWDNEHGGLGVNEYICQAAFPYLLQTTIRETIRNNNLTCYNVGYSGKDAGWGLDNFDAIFGGAYSDADIVIIGFGINDRLYYNNNINSLRIGFKSNINAIIDKVVALGKTPILMTSQPGMQCAIRTNHVGTDYDKMTFSYIPHCVCNAVKKEISVERGVELIDLNEFGEKVLLSGIYNPLDVCSDYLHFNDLGHKIEGSYLSKIIYSRTIVIDMNVNKIGFNNQLVKSDYYINTDFITDNDWYFILSCNTDDVTKAMIDVCIFMEKDARLETVGTNAKLVVNGVEETGLTKSLNAYQFYHVSVYPNSIGSIILKGFEFL